MLVVFNAEQNSIKKSSKKKVKKVNENTLFLHAYSLLSQHFERLD